MNKSEIFKKTVRTLLYPKKCIFCDEFIFSSERNTCRKCRESLPYISGKICFGCGCEKHECSCTGNISYYDKVAGAFYYQDRAKKCIRDMKFKSRISYAKPVSKYMFDAMSVHLAGEKFDFISYVPTHKDDNRGRDFNQSREIAYGISEITGIPVKDGLIKKLYRTPRQSEQSAIKRTGNVMGVFDVCEDISGTSVLLIDDIKTTGSTLSECAKMLRLYGAENICCLCMAVSKNDYKR